MLDTIRAYSLERLAEAGEQSALRHRICDYYLGLAETADPLLRTSAQRHWFNVLAAESGNMLAALRWAIEQRDEDTALRLVAALGWYWLMFGLRGDSASLARAALALGAGERAADRAKAEARAVCALVGMGSEWDTDGLREPLAAAFAAVGADPSGQPPHPLVAVAGASMAVIGGDGERALELLTAYLDAADPWIRAAARLQRVVYACNLGRIEEAAADCAAALADFREIGEIYGTTMALMMRADLDLLAGDCGGAIAALEEAIGLGRQLAEWGDVGYLYGKLAAARIRAGDHAAARADLGRAAATPQRPGETDFFLRLVRAELAWREGDLPGALRLGEDLAAGLAAKSAAAWAPMRALVSARLGVLRLEAGDQARASAALRDALQAAAVTRDRPATAAAVQGLAAAALRLASPAQAAELLGAADSIRGAVDHTSLDAPGIRAAGRERLGPAAFDTAYRRGRAMTYDAAVAFAQASAADASTAGCRFGSGLAAVDRDRERERTPPRTRPPRPGTSAPGRRPGRRPSARGSRWSGPSSDSPARTPAASRASSPGRRTGCCRTRAGTSPGSPASAPRRGFSPAGPAAPRASTWPGRRRAPAGIRRQQRAGWTPPGTPGPCRSRW